MHKIRGYKKAIWAAMLPMFLNLQPVLVLWDLALAAKDILELVIVFLRLITQKISGNMILIQMPGRRKQTSGERTVTGLLVSALSANGMLERVVLVLRLITQKI